MVQKFLENSDVRPEIDVQDSNRQTPLHLACLRGMQNCVVSEREGERERGAKAKIFSKLQQ